MKKNMGTTDKVIRLIVAIAIIALFFAEIISGTIATVLLTLAIVFIITPLINFCPLYALFGISTCPKKE